MTSKYIFLSIVNSRNITNDNYSLHKDFKQEKKMCQRAPYTGHVGIIRNGEWGMLALLLNFLILLNFVIRITVRTNKRNISISALLVCPIRARFTLHPFLSRSAIGVSVEAIDAVNSSDDESESLLALCLVLVVFLDLNVNVFFTDFTFDFVAFFAISNEFFSGGGKLALYANVPRMK